MIDTNLRPPDGVPEPIWSLLAREGSGRWEIPERDQNGEVIGTAYRFPDGSKDFCAIGQLRHPLGRNEARHLDLAAPRRSQRFDEGHLRGHRHDRLLVLQPIPGADLGDADALHRVSRS